MYRMMHSIVNGVSRKLGYRIVRDDRFPRCTCNMLDLGVPLLRSISTPVRVVQIGASDGVFNDPLRKHLEQGCFSGALIEPIPEVYNQLKINCSHYKNVNMVNCAVSDEDGVVTLNVPKKRISSKFHQKASMYKGNTLKSGISKDELAVIQVPCFTVKTLLMQLDMEEIDLMVVDTEGHDFKIVRKAFEDGIEPKIVFLEVLHLDRSQRHALRTLFDDRNYSYIEEVKDVMAIKRDIFRETEARSNES